MTFLFIVLDPAWSLVTKIRRFLCTLGMQYASFVVVTAQLSVKFSAFLPIINCHFYGHVEHADSLIIIINKLLL